MDLFWHTLRTLQATVFDVAPIILILVICQVFVLRRPLPSPHRIVIGFSYVIIGLSLFIVGLEQALFPLGKIMAAQLTSTSFLGIGETDTVTNWAQYGWVYAFAFAIGFATTIAEPPLIAVSLKAHEVSGGAIPVFGLRLIVALGVGIGVTIGSFRIVTGTPLPVYIIAGYVFVLIQTIWAPRMIVPLAYDSGGVTTSTVTVPVVTALGLGLASAIPGRSPLIDGFGLIAFASLFPIMAVLAFASFASWTRRNTRPPKRGDSDEPEADRSPGRG